MIEEIEYRKTQLVAGASSFSLVLPKAYATRLGIRKGDFLKVRQTGHSIIIEKA
jgi:hypothetical protein